MVDSLSIDWRLAGLVPLTSDGFSLEFERVSWVRLEEGVEIDCEFDHPDAFAVAMLGRMTVAMGRAEAESFVVGKTYRMEFV